MSDYEYHQRLVRLDVPDEAIPAIFRDGAGIIDGLPRGSQIVRMYDVPRLQAKECVFRHESFDVVPEAAEIPVRRFGIDFDWNIPEDGLYRGDRTKDDGVSEITMSHEIFSALFWDGTEVHSDLPSDVRLLTMYEEPERRVVTLQMISEEFEKPDEGAPCPRTSMEASDLWSITNDNSGVDNEVLSSYVGDSDGE